MAHSIKREQYTFRGRRVTLDTAQLSTDCYETMLLYPNGGEIASATAKTAYEALQQYARIRAAHLPDSERPAPAPLCGKYARLRDDLKKALAAGRAAEDADPEDGGTCNRDSAALSLPRWTASKVKQAAKEAGTGCFIWTFFGSHCFVIDPKTCGQGNARSRNTEAMIAALQSMGYDAHGYYQMD